MSLLGNPLGGRRGGGMSPTALGLLGLLAYRTSQRKGRLADMPGRTEGDGAAAHDAPRQGGLGDKAETWVAKGPNAQIAPADLARALGPEKLAWLMRETGCRAKSCWTG